MDDNQDEMVIVEDSTDEGTDVASDTVSDAVSDTVSDTSCLTSVTDISIYHEFDQTIAELHMIQTQQQDAMDRLEQLLKMSFAQEVDEEDDNELLGVYGPSGEWVPLELVLDRLAADALAEIKKTGGEEPSYTTRLLEYLNRIETSSASSE